MRELTVNEQEAVNGGGWNLWEIAGGGFAIAGGVLDQLGELGMAVPPIGGYLEVAGGVCEIIGALMN